MGVDWSKAPSPSPCDAGIEVKNKKGDFLASTCTRIGRKSEGIPRTKEGGGGRGGDVLGLTKGDEDVGGLDVEVRQLLLVQVLQASGHLATQSTDL